MATISAVADALETTIENVSNLRVFSELEDIVNPPACVITFNGIEFDKPSFEYLPTELFNFSVFLTTTFIRFSQLAKKSLLALVDLVLVFSDFAVSFLFLVIPKFIAIFKVIANHL